MGERGIDLYNAYTRIDPKIADEYYAKLHPDVVDQFERAVNELYIIVMSGKGRDNDGLE